MTTQLKLIENDSLKGAFNKSKRSGISIGLQDGRGISKPRILPNFVTTEIDHKIDVIFKTLQTIQGSLDVFSVSFQQQSSGVNSSGGGGGMDDEIKKINEKISAIEKDVSITSNDIKNINETLKRHETNFGKIEKKLDELPTKSDMSVIVQDILQKLNLPSKEYVTAEVGKSEISLHKWIVSTGIAVTVLVSGIVFGIVKIMHP